MSVNKKELILIFCKVLSHGLKGKKAPQRAVFDMQFFVRAECFAYVPVRALTIARILLGSLGAPVFTMIYGIYSYFFRFTDLMFLSFSQGKIRTPKKSATPRGFEHSERTLH